MSGLEIVASIAGVATAAIKVSVTMSDLAEDLGSAGRDVRYISNEMACFSQVLRLVHSSLEDSAKVVGSLVIKSALDTLPQLIEQCGIVHEEANGLMVALKPSTGKELPFFNRVKYIFRKSRITVLRSLLDSSKNTLNLLLVTLNIEMAKTKSPNKDLMDQLQNERKAFIRVVHSQSKALGEALKEVEKAKKEATKLKSKVDKEKEKEKEKDKQMEGEKQDDNSKLHPPLMLHSAPSMSQLVYTPPVIDTTPQNAVVSLALTLEPPKLSGDAGKPTPPTYPPDYNPSYGSSTTYSPPSPKPPVQPFPPANSQTAEPPPPQPPLNKPYFEQRVFSDPGPVPSKPAPNENLHPGGTTRERSRSPYGFSRIPKDEAPKVERKRSPYTYQPPPSPGAAKNESQNRGESQRGAFENPEDIFATFGYAFGDDFSSSAPQEPQREQRPHTYQPPPPSYHQTNPGNAPGSESPPMERQRAPYSSVPPRKPSASQPQDQGIPTPDSPPVERQRAPYGSNIPPRKPSASQPQPQDASKPDPAPTESQRPSYTTVPPRKPAPPQPESTQKAKTPAKPTIPPPPPPRHGSTYVALRPYLSHEVGHLSLVPFDTLVDVISYTSEEDTLPYPTAFDSAPKHFWQASLGHRRGPRGLFPVDVVCEISDQRVAEKMRDSWFAGKEVGLVADGNGRVWVGPEWEFREPVRRRSKWWGEEF